MLVILAYCNIGNREDCQDTINNELLNIYQWFTSNKLSLNLWYSTPLRNNIVSRYKHTYLHSITIEIINQFYFSAYYNYKQ